MKICTVKDLVLSYHATPSAGTLFSQADSLQSENHWSLSPLSFSIEPGQGLAIIGDNGAGKSSILRAVAGLIPIDSGIVNIPERTLAVLDLNLLFHPDFSGYENLYMMNACHGRSDAQLNEVMDQVIQFAGLEEAVHRPVREYSSGMRMRLGVAYVMFQDFELLIIDEVLAVGDLAFQRQTISRMRDLLAEGKSLLLSSHNMLEVSSLCSEVVFLDHGEVLTQGNPEDVLAEYFQAAEKKGKFAELIDGRKGLGENNSQDVQISNVRVLDAEGVEIEILQSGQAFQIEVQFHIEGAPIINPLMRVEFFRNDGLMVAGMNNFRQGVHWDLHPGEAAIRIRYPSLNLLAGRYYLSLSLWPDEYASMVTHEAYVHHDRCYSLIVQSQRQDGAGVASQTCFFEILGPEE